MYHKILLSSALLSFCFAAVPATAQSQAIEITDNNPAPSTAPTIGTAPETTRRIIRNVEPIPYWVEADQLRIRDNPVAGDVVGLLKLGQKIKAYDTFENWIRVSKLDAKERWVNANFLTSEQVTWARFDNNTRRRNIGFSRNTAANDITLKRIKIAGDKDAKVYAASLKKTANNNRIIVTRQNFRSGPYFEKRFVSCGPNNNAKRFQLLGEGYNYIMMEKDIRAQTIDVNSAEPRVDISSGDVSAKSIAIANFSCKTSSLN